MNEIKYLWLLNIKNKEQIQICHIYLNMDISTIKTDSQGHQDLS